MEIKNGKANERMSDKENEDPERNFFPLLYANHLL
jgi:hypothetical protein